MTAPLLLNLVAALAALAILWRAEPALARMQAATHWMIRYALLFIAGGAIGIITTILAGARIDLITALLLVGIALLLLCERRVGVLVKIRRGGQRA